MINNKLTYTLIFESGAGGHRKEYIEYLFLFLKENPNLRDKFIFVLNEDLLNQIDSNLYSLDQLLIESINTKGSPKGLFFRALWEWKKIEEILSIYKDVTKIIFLNLDVYLFLIISPVFTKYKLEVNGILFQPYLHLPEFKIRNINSLKHKLRKYAKYVTISLISKSKLIKRIFILNDEKGVKILNKIHAGKKPEIFYCLPDPIDTRNLLKENGIEYIQKTYNISSGKKILLLLGRIDERKNIYNITRALTNMHSDLQAKVVFIIAGEFVFMNKDKIKSHLLNVMKQYPSLQIVLKDEFIPNLEMEYLFKGCDIVLMPYLNFYSSSGVIGHAAKYNKKVIVSSLGIVKDSVEKYSLGIAINPSKPCEIKDAIVFLLTNNIITENSETFVKEHHYLKFSKILLSN
jgi:hypothetical protein